VLGSHREVVMRRSTLAAVAVLSLMTTDCFYGGSVTTAEMRRERSNPDRGSARVFPGKCSMHFARAHRTFKRLDLEVIYENSATGELIGKRPKDAPTRRNDLVAVWLNKRGSDACIVRVHGKFQGFWSGAGTRSEWESEFFHVHGDDEDAEE